MSLEKLAFEMAPIGIALTEHRVIQSCNTTFCKLFGYPREALIGQSFRMLYGSDHEFRQVRDVGIDQLKQSAAYSDERIMGHRDGSRLWCRFRAQTLTPDDPLAQVVLTFAPMTDNPKGPALTPREREVVLWLSKGKTSKEIAQILDLSPRTIEDVRARLLRKFNVKTAAALLARLSYLGQ